MNPNINRARFWFAFFALGFVICARAQESTADKDGFYEPRSAVLTRIKRVGLLPPRVVEFVGPRPEVKAHLEAELTAQLTAAGFTVVGSQAYTHAFDEMNKTIGGIYSAETGDLDKTKDEAVRDHALRTFIEGEKLDGLLDIAIVRVKANFYANTTTWHGVTERTTGTPMSKNLIKAMWYAPTGTQGTLPALSLVIVLRDTNRKPLYMDFGGIQMTAYRNVEVKESFSTFVSVPEDKLLRDIPRIDRAIGIVVAPLAFSPEERKAKEGAAAAPKSTHKKKDKNMVEPAPATVLPPLPEGVVANGESPFIVPREQILAQTKTVVLMPVLVGGVPRDKETTVATRYRQYITADLHRLGITVVDPGKLLEAWNQEIGKNNFYDPYTGEFDKERHSAVRRAAYARAKRDTPFDAVIWPTILRRTAEYSYGDAVWDGVKQNLASVESSWTSSGGAVGGSGSVHAVSLYLKLCDTNDNELYRSVGGIQLIEKVSSGGLYASANKSEPLTPSQLFSDPQRDATAVHIALRSLVFTPEELDELLHPKPPESEKKGKKKY